MIPFLAFLALQTDSPRATYWQQQVSYDIAATLDEDAGVLRGTQVMRYLNRSPDTLRTISFHLHLNAFRPGSSWSAADSVEGRRRFNDLKDPAYAFNHVANVRVMGQAVEATWPFAPDSTIVRFQLPRPLPPGGQMEVTMDWDARLSTVPRRQGRRGRQYDFAHSYPKVVVYDKLGWQEQPLFPAGEFYGEFATYRVALDVPGDQVIGATGVPVCGDPGWSGARIEYGRQAYGSRPGSCRARPAAEGRKVVEWYAEKVHHFAFSMNPEYRYEGGRYKNTLIHVLYRPGDDTTWGKGIAVQRTATALGWLDSLFGEFGWPQITNVHRLDGGGTEFPMMMHNSSANQGLIIHELGHNYTMGLLANNEWREGWLDEGFTSFQTGWFFEIASRRSGYPGLEEGILGLDLDDYSEPVSLVSDKYRDFNTYNTMIYSRGQLFFEQLRYLVGDETMREILRTFYDRWKYKHVDEAAFREVAEEVSKRDLSHLFAQWLHGTTLYDYAVGSVKRRQDDQGWVTRVEVRRKAPGIYPVDVAVIAKGDTAVVRTDGLAEREFVEVRTRTRPREVRLDPNVRSHDWNMLNNQRGFGVFGRKEPKPYPYFDTGLSQKKRRDRKATGVMPLIWWNDAGGVTAGFRTRDNYMGRFELNQAYLTRSLGTGDSEGLAEWDFFTRVRNPVGLRTPNVSQTFEAYRVEGRYGGLVSLDWSRREHLGWGTTWRAGVALELVGIDDTRYLDPGLYEDVGIVEARWYGGANTRSGNWLLDGTLSLGGGLHYNRDGLIASGRDLDPFYFRGSVEGTARRGFKNNTWALGTRIFAGTAFGEDQAAAKQRQFYVGGSDPLSQLRNPLLRSRGAAFVGQDFNYHAVGGGSVRGTDLRISAKSITAASVDLERVVRSRPRAKLITRAAIAAFGDAAVAFGDALPLTTDESAFVGSAGLGVRLHHRLGETPFVTRFDFPFYVSRPEWSQNGKQTSDEFAFRWVFGLEVPIR